MVEPLVGECVSVEIHVLSLMGKSPRMECLGGGKMKSLTPFAWRAPEGSPQA